MSWMSGLHQGWADLTGKQLPLLFLHHQPARGNIGDELCSPKHYFDMVSAVSGVTIVGGGVFADFGLKRMKKLRRLPSRAVLWGTGISVRDPLAAVEKITTLPYAFWGLRDGDRVDDAHFLPCVSCLHSMLDAPVPAAGSTLLFINVDPKVSSVGALDALREMAMDRGWDFLLNNCEASELANALAGARHVVTNSFHGTYWGLLAGRQVTCIGYSSKFVSLLRVMGLDPAMLIPVQRGSHESLVNAVSEVDDDSRAVALNDSVAVRQAFRSRNLGFAQRLEGSSLFSSVRPR